MPKLILDRRTMSIIRAPSAANAKPTPAKPLPDVSWTIQKGEDGYPATLKAVAVPATQTPTPTPSAANTNATPYTITTELPAVIADGRVVLTYR